MSECAHANSRPQSSLSPFEPLKPFESEICITERAIGQLGTPKLISGLHFASFRLALIQLAAS